MKGIIIKCKDALSMDCIDRLREEFKRDLERDGFIVIDDNFEIREINTEED